MKFLIEFLLLQSALAQMDTSWWKFTTMYEIYVWSFKDSDGDGIGDLKGVTQMLDHFVDLKIETLYLSPYYKSPMLDMGYDVSNFTEIDPRFGTMEDFDHLVSEMNKRDLKLIIDMVINHSSDEHPWFIKSINKVHPYRDYYVWKNAKDFDGDGNPIPPNNWVCMFGGSAWEWNSERNQFYLHQFAVKQPDLNLRNKDLKKEIMNIAKFWLDKGVAGMRLDATKHFIEDAKFKDEPQVDPKATKIEKYLDLEHIYTSDLWDSYEFIHDLRTYVDEYSRLDEGFERILIAEAYTDDEHTMAYYGKKNYPITHFPFNFRFVGLHIFLDARDYKKYCQKWLEIMPHGAVANWVAENHDNPRIGNRLNKKYGDIIITTIMMAPGIACLYYGQEIGMINNPVRNDQKKDPNNDGVLGISRDPERLPMQWDDSINSGFTSQHKPWLPVNPNYWDINVKAQKNKNASTYNLVKNLSEIRKTATLKHGSLQSYVISTWVYAFTRTLKGHDTYVTVINLGTETEIIDLHMMISNLTPLLEIVASSSNSGYLKGTKVRYIPRFPRMLTMRPLSTVVLKTIHKHAFLKEIESFEVLSEPKTSS